MPRPGPAVLCSILIASSLLLGACAASFKETARKNPECAAIAEIRPVKVEDCLSTTRHKDEFNTCLASRGVPPWQIERYDGCVRNHRNSY
jgi:hypothetical protein